MRRLRPMRRTPVRLCVAAPCRCARTQPLHAYRGMMIIMPVSGDRQVAGALCGCSEAAHVDTSEPSRALDVAYGLTATKASGCGWRA